MYITFNLYIFFFKNISLKWYQWWIVLVKSYEVLIQNFEEKVIIIEFYVDLGEFIENDVRINNCDCSWHE